MRLISEIRDSNVFEGTQNQDPVHFFEEQTSRAILINTLGQIGLLYVEKKAYHKLPGGKLEPAETPLQALERELLEEMGCRAKILDEVGMIVEYQNERQRKQTSFCYLARQEGERVAPAFTESELKNRYREVWVDDVDTAIGLVNDDSPIDYSRMFIRSRELAFLKAYRSNHI